MDAWAQSGSNAQNSLLPEINPQDIEIRSEFRARFPGLRRQPILGFNPKPRVFQIDPNRVPFMETRDEAVASIAITQLDRPEPPEKTIIQSPLRRNIYARAGFGSFITPEFNGYFFQDISDKSAISGNVDFSSSDGHLDNQLSGFRFLDGDVRLSSKVNRQTRLEASIGGVYDFNRLYNLEPIYQDVIGSTAQKSYNGLNAGISINSIKNALEGIQADLSFNTYNSELDAGTTDLGGKSSEYFLNGSFKKYWPGSRLYETLSVSADVMVGSYENALNNAENVLQVGVNGEYKRLINFNIHITANAGLSYISDGISNRIYFAPQALVTYNLKDALILKGGLSGSPGFRSLQDHYQANRFLSNDTVLRHSYESKAFVEGALQLIEGNRVYAGVDYSITKNKAYYDRKTETRIGQIYQLFYDLNFDKATEFQLYGGVTQQINPQTFWFDVRVYARRPKLDNGGDIPYEERIGANTSISYKPTNELLLSGWVDFVGERVAPSVNEDLSAFTLVSFSADYEITPKFGVYAKVLNILGQEYELWDGFEERPFQVFGGLILKF
jgi:hypothetical protein